jgi:hypothetical protein
MIIKWTGLTTRYARIDCAMCAGAGIVVVQDADQPSITGDAR